MTQNINGTNNELLPLVDGQSISANSQQISWKGKKNKGSKKDAPFRENNKRLRNNNSDVDLSTQGRRSASNNASGAFDFKKKQVRINSQGGENTEEINGTE